MAANLAPHQIEVLSKIKNGSILCGETGSGKSRTGIAYYLKTCGYDVDSFDKPNKDNLKKLYIITTAQKRDKLEWEGELVNFLIDYEKVVIDSWNNVHKYVDVKDCFFLFDEQKVVGYGLWAKSFIQISKSNEWILLTATPGDTYMDYVPVFIANGYFKNKTDFIKHHVIYNRFCKYPKVDYYENPGYLEVLVKKILVNMNYEHKIGYHYEKIMCNYDKQRYLDVVKTKWNPFENKPIQNASEFCYTLRKVNNMDGSRLDKVKELYAKFGRLIVFYNFDYELETLLKLKDISIVNQWNGHCHEPVPYADKWIYLVQYSAGSEGWNCIECNCVVYYSNNYSYKIMKQAAGRIDRMNTLYTDLYYYYLVSNSSIDISILNSIQRKKAFNEKIYSAKFGI